MIASFLFRVRVGLALVSFFALSLIAVGDLWATVTVQSADGRELSGEVDDRTTDEQLWIRREENRIVLATSIRWSSVVAAAVDGNAVEVSTLAEQWPQLKSGGPADFFSQAIEVPVALDKPDLIYRPIPLRIVALEIDAALVQLDRDVEPDGFELLVVALDSHGQRVSVRGNITARLVGERDEQHSGRIRFEELQRWSLPVDYVDFQHGVACYPLRFRTVRPEFDWELIPQALLNVRLGVYGQGNFEATIPVVIRPFNPVRDQLQKYEHSRFLREELSEEVRRRRIR